MQEKINTYVRVWIKQDEGKSVADIYVYVYCTYICICIHAEHKLTANRRIILVEGVSAGNLW